MPNPEEAEAFEWDDDEQERGNTAHLADHGIDPVEAEQVFYNEGRFAPNKKGMSGDWLLVGRTDGGRVLTLVAVYKDDQRVIRFITGWDSTGGEQARYL
jgi:uncharacterized DUF497 family protein